MNTDDDKVREPGARSPEPPHAAKAPYIKPVLRVYGSVSRLTMGGGGSKADGSLKDKSTSDRATKTAIVRIGEHSGGIGLYLFQYKPAFRDECGDGWQIGVMADEVEKVLPDAVSLRPDGYKQVDYALLGPASHRTVAH